MTLEKDIDLVKVKTITAKLAKQVRLLSFDSYALRMEILDDLASTDPHGRIIGWADHRTVFNPTGTDPSFKMWLVKYRGQLLWIVAPDNFTHAADRVPQLFIS